MTPLGSARLGRRLADDKTKVISYQSAYDSLNQNDEPSYAISGGVTLGGLVPNVEVAVFGPFLADGYTVIVPDTPRGCAPADRDVALRR
jgi:hypothetical protein